MEVLERLGLFILRDGSMVRVAPARHEDRARILRFLRDLSPESRSMRFLSACVDMEALADILSDVDGHDRVALMATTPSGDEVIGHACWERAGLGRAEAAVVVAEPYRRRGIGSMLLRRLAESAAAKGIRVFEGYSAPENNAIVSCVRSFPATVRSSPGWTRIEFPTRPFAPSQRTPQAAA